jgi:hypothetical protein
MTAEEGFAVDRHAAAGRKSHCRVCDRERTKAYYAAHRDELYAAREAVREAAWQAELEALEVEHKKRAAEQRKLHEAQVGRQKKLLRELGVPDLSPEEISERARRNRGSVAQFFWSGGGGVLPLATATAFVGGAHIVLSVT